MTIRQMAVAQSIQQSSTCQHTAAEIAAAHQRTHKQAGTIFSANQLSVTVGAPQAGFHCDPSAVVTSDNSTCVSAPLLRLNLSDRKGYQQDYSIEDAATSLWKKDNLTFNLNNPASFDRWVSRFQNGVSSAAPTEAELTAYIGQLRQAGLDGTVDWSGLEKNLCHFKPPRPTSWQTA